LAEKTLADEVSSAKSANVFTAKVLCYTVVLFLFQIQKKSKHKKMVFTNLNFFILWCKEEKYKEN